ncbi:helix-turn-helix domain-containing protein [Nonomuraea mangrovi]|uniref:Helix-turn-helix domain-containing protein n=1 Tax=Nonomuraea mangrovi TaxID=2316207 RepID=A0ABW4T308_9ACTN
MELIDKVRELRGQGKSPKEIARALGVPPSRVAPLVRAIAAESPAGEAGEVVGSWVNTGWSVGLTADGWVDEAPAEDGTNGTVCVLVARKHGWDKFLVCGYLIDTYCLGVKNTVGPDTMDERELRRFRDYFFSDFPGWQEAPFELARELVLGSVEYARGLGFEPHEDFAPAEGHLGEGKIAGTVSFGRDGRPFYVAGPNDDPRKVLRQLERAVGKPPAFGYVIV